MKRLTLMGLVAVMTALLACESAKAQRAPITDPEGTRVSYSCDGRMHYPYLGWMNNEYYGWDAVDVVFGDNGEVYFECPLKGWRTKTFIKGKIVGAKAVFELPQLIEVKNGVEYYVDRMIYEPGGDDDDPMYINDGKHTITYDYDNLTGVFKMELTTHPNGRPLGLGLCDVAGAWLGAAESVQELTPFTDEKLTPPAGLNTQEWGVHHNYGDYTVRIGFVKDQCWIQGISPNVPDSWIVGTVFDNDRGGKSIRFYGEQYLGVGQFNKHTYFMSTMTTPYDAEWNQVWIDPTDYIDVDYDPEEGAITADDWTSYVCNPGKASLSYNECYLFFSMKRQGERMPAAPADPVITKYVDFDTSLGYGLIGFTFPCLDVNGCSLDQNKMAFSFFVDGKVYVFRPERYGVPLAATEIPFGFMDNENFSCLQSYHQFNFFEQPYEKVGLQTRYVIGNGYELVSEMVERDVNSGGVESVEAEVVAVEYYDMQGRKVDEPGQGLYIRVSRKADGTVKSDKAVFKQ